MGIHLNSNMDLSTNSPPVKQPRSQSIIHLNNNISLQRQPQRHHPKQPRSQSTIHPRSKLIKSLVMLHLHQLISPNQRTSRKNPNMLHLQYQLKLHISFMLVTHQFISTNNHKYNLLMPLHQPMELQNRFTVSPKNHHMPHLQNLQPIRRKNQCIPHHPNPNQLTKLLQNPLIKLLQSLPNHLTKLQLPSHLITNQSHPSIKLQPSPPHTKYKSLQNISQNQLQNNLQSTSQDLHHQLTKSQNHQSMKLLQNQSHPNIIPNKLILLLRSLLP